MRLSVLHAMMDKVRARMPQADIWGVNIAEWF